MYYIVQLCITFTHLAKEIKLRGFSQFLGKYKGFSLLCKGFSYKMYYNYTV